MWTADHACIVQACSLWLLMSITNLRHIHPPGQIASLHSSLSDTFIGSPGSIDWGLNSGCS